MTAGYAVPTAKDDGLLAGVDEPNIAEAKTVPHVNAWDAPEQDGESPIIWSLDDKGSVVAYLPSFGLPGTILAELEATLAASEASNEPPPEDSSSQSGRRQWFAEIPDRPLGWRGPRRWRLASWKLAGNEQLRPVLAIHHAVEAAIAALDAKLAETGISCRPRLLEQYNTVLVNRYLSGATGIKWHADNSKFYSRSPEAGTSDIAIASVSLGAERWFEFRTEPRNQPDVKSQRSARIKLKAGSLLLMAGSTQRYWQHCLPKDESCKLMRYNLTFRRVMTAQEDPQLAIERTTCQR